ncbi:MAG: DUF3090 family protein [Chloroflexi bacterium]|nr:DUF3090 family protein [Chloroflexota bacterium]
MADAPIDFGPLQRLDAQALGAPGQRTFRLVAANRRGTAWLWLEKEELQVLGMTIEQMLGGLPLDPALQPSQPPAAASAHEDDEDRPAIEFKVGRLAMGYEETADLFVLLVHEIDVDPDGAPTLRCLVSRRQLRALAQQISTVCAAGRPRCPLCGVVLGGPHACPRLN